jgi:hypothetical protein
MTDDATPLAGSGSGKPALDSDMTSKEKIAMTDQMEEFEGPEGREIRGDHCEPKKDPGVAHS